MVLALKVKAILLVVLLLMITILTSGCLSTNSQPQNTSTQPHTGSINTYTHSTTTSSTTTSTPQNKEEHKIITKQVYNGDSVQIYWRGYDRDTWVLKKIKVNDLYAVKISPYKMYTVIDPGVILDNIKIVPVANIYKIDKTDDSFIEVIAPTNKLSAFNMYYSKDNSTVFLGMFIIKPVNPMSIPQPKIIDSDYNITRLSNGEYKVEIKLWIKAQHLPLLYYLLNYDGNYYNLVNYDITTNQLTGETKALIEITGNESIIKLWNPIISYIVYPEDSKIFSRNNPLYSGRIVLTGIKNDIVNELNKLPEEENTSINKK